MKFTQWVRAMLENYEKRRYSCVLPVQMLILVVLVPLLISCTSYEVEDHSLQFNEAVGSLGNRLLLLNAVRAAKGYPMQFSKLQTYTGQGRADGGVSLDLPFVANTVGQGILPPARLIGSAKPSINLRTGMQSLQLVDLNTAEAQRALRTQATAKDLEYYMLQGWPPRLVITIVIEGVRVPEKFVTALGEHYARHCRAKQDDPECWLYRERQACRDAGSGRPKGVSQDKRRDISYISFENDARSPCSFLMFQWFLDALVLGGGTFDIPAKKTLKKGDGKKDNAKKKDQEKKQEAIYRSDRFAIDVNVKLPEKEAADTTPTGSTLSGSVDLFFQKQYFEDLYQELKNTKDSDGNSIDVLEIVFRSPERMVRFLGDVIAAQQLARERNEIRIRVGEHVVPLFRVEHGRRVTGREAISVTGPEGERFFIPVPDYGSPTTHMSLHALALVTDFLNSAVSGKSLPPPSTLIITGG